MKKVSVVLSDDIAVALTERARIEVRSVGAVIRRAVAEHVGRPAGDEDVAGASAPTPDAKDADGR